MECKQARELHVAYVLGALDEDERELMESHLEGCSSCTLTTYGDCETIARLAMTVPALAVPPGVKQRLFERVHADTTAHAVRPELKGLVGLCIALSHRLASNASKALAAVLVVGAMAAALWYNMRLDELEQRADQLNSQVTTVAQQNRALESQVRSVSAREKEVIQMVKSQRDLTYEAIRMSATPGTYVNMLWGTTGWTSGARGMVVASRNGDRALLLAVDLPPLPETHVYQVWLLRGGKKYDGGFFTVDSTGYGQIVIIPVAPLALFDGIGITIEPLQPEESSAGGTVVLKGDL